MSTIERTVHSRVPKTDDIEIHVSTLDTENGQYTDIREFVVSLEQYGRGITFPARLTEEVQRGLYEAFKVMVEVEQRV